jgi:predicted regulator of Ras-like GTPase activity (Roadblock/LC7/MglB family)
MHYERVRLLADEVARDAGSLSFLPLIDALRREGQLDDAHRYALRGLEEHPHLAAAHDALAKVLSDQGRDAQAYDEWQFALRLDPTHLPSLRGLGFLAYRRRDLAGAERLLSQALRGNQADEGLAAALRRVREELRGTAPNRPTAPVERQPAPARREIGATSAHTLFAPVLGDGDRTALLLDRDGLVLAGTYVDGSGRDVAEEIGAHLGGLADEATRALAQLGLGAWESLVVEAQHATVALAPAPEGAVVMVAAARDTQVGLVRRLLGQARQRAAGWMGVPA